MVIGRSSVLLLLFTWLVTPVQAYCNWNGCNGEIQGGDWCNADESQCMTCGGSWCGDGGGGGGGGGGDGSTGNGSEGQATTTRYWDCSGGSCGCGYLYNGQSNLERHCNSNALFTAPVNNPFGAKLYGAAAISATLGGGDWLAEGCGKCFQVTGTSNIPGNSGISTTLVLKATNYCPPSNPSCNGKAHFDIAAPGFDYAGASLWRRCADVAPEENEAMESCGMWMINNEGTAACDCSLFKNSVLRAGCENFLSLGWNNPSVTYKEVDCPIELAQLPCWEENGGGWPIESPDLCSDPYALNGTPQPGPTDQPVTPPTETTPSTPVSNAPPTGTPTTVSPTDSPQNPSSSCCSWDNLTCPGSSEWCDMQQSHCEEACSGIWLDSDRPPPSCIPKWGECTHDTAACCAGVCQGNEYYKQCL